MLSPSGPGNNWYYNPSLKLRASELRQNPTRSEKKLWYGVLRDNQTGYKFMRQRPMLNYIVDFFCKELRLVIEVDGWTHQLQGQVAYDLKRQQEIESVGLTVIRFEDDEVMGELDSVRDKILGWIGLWEVENGLNSPP